MYKSALQIIVEPKIDVIAKKYLKDKAFRQAWEEFLILSQHIPNDQTLSTLLADRSDKLTQERMIQPCDFPQVIYIYILVWSESGALKEKKDSQMILHIFFSDWNLHHAFGE